jgi:hypothetical protein
VSACRKLAPPLEPPTWCSGQRWMQTSLQTARYSTFTVEWQIATYRGNIRARI